MQSNQALGLQMLMTMRRLSIGILAGVGLSLVGCGVGLDDTEALNAEVAGLGVVETPVIGAVGVAVPPAKETSPNDQAGGAEKADPSVQLPQDPEPWDDPATPEIEGPPMPLKKAGGYLYPQGKDD